MDQRKIEPGVAVRREGDVPDGEFDIGHRLRQVRTGREMTLSELARRSGLTRSFLTQVENGRVSPSVASVQKIASALGISLGALFTRPSDHNPVVRRHERPRLRYPVAGINDELLTPSMTGKLQVLYATIEGQGESGEELYTHEADEECIVVLSGVLEVRLAGEQYLLEQGDAITFSSRIPHGWRNPLHRKSECMWIMTPAGFYS